MASISYQFTLIVMLSLLHVRPMRSVVYDTEKFVLPDDGTFVSKISGKRQEMLDDLLQREYSDRYRNFIENSLAAAAADNLGDEVRSAARQFDKRAQTFVRFGKRAQTFVRFGK